MEPLQITEFASERYFSKLKQLNETPQSAITSSTTEPVPTEASLPPLPLQQNTFALPLGQRCSLDHEALNELAFRPGDLKKRSLGHDLMALKTQRRPTLSSGFGTLKSKVTIINKPPLVTGHRQNTLDRDDYVLHPLTASDLFFSLPNELQAQVIAPLPIHDLLILRLVSKSFHAMVTRNESPIARYHISHILPRAAVRLYPPPHPADVNLYYICSIWHRLNVAVKLSAKIASQATKEVFSRRTENEQREFSPQQQRMGERLVPLVFTLFHFFESYRSLHIQHLARGGAPMNRQAYTWNPLECQVMATYDDQTLLQVHQAFPLIISSFSRRLRPPSYAGTFERHLKGYHKDRPADEVYVTILVLGGLRQAQRFWETKGYNARRAAVDLWYACVTKTPVDEQPKSKMAWITQFGRKKLVAPPEQSSPELVSTHDSKVCNEWFCIKPSCQAAKKRHSTRNPVFNSSLAAGPPMSPLTHDDLRLAIPDLPHLSNIWMHTAEALILERKIVLRPQDIKRNAQFLLQLIREDNGMWGLKDWTFHHRGLKIGSTASLEAVELLGNMSE